MGENPSQFWGEGGSFQKKNAQSQVQHCLQGFGRDPDRCKAPQHRASPVSRRICSWSSPDHFLQRSPDLADDRSPPDGVSHDRFQGPDRPPA